MRRAGTSVGCAVAALAAYAGALAVLVRGYPHALATACPNDAPAPVAFWPLLLGAVALALVTFMLRPRRKNERGKRSGADLFAIFFVIAMPLVALATLFGFAISYACWQ